MPFFNRHTKWDVVFGASAFSPNVFFLQDVFFNREKSIILIQSVHQHKLYGIWRTSNLVRIIHADSAAPTRLCAPSPNGRRRSPHLYSTPPPLVPASLGFPQGQASSPQDRKRRCGGLGPPTRRPGMVLQALHGSDGGHWTLPAHGTHGDPVSNRMRRTRSASRRTSSAFALCYVHPPAATSTAAAADLAVASRSAAGTRSNAHRHKGWLNPFGKHPCSTAPPLRPPSARWNAAPTRELARSLVPLPRVIFGPLSHPGLWFCCCSIT
jgi:hypothetical protein